MTRQFVSQPRSAGKSAALRKREIGLIKMGQAQLGLDDHTYRRMLASLCDGKTSASDLTWQQRQAVIQHMKNSGFRIEPSPHTGRAWDDGLSKLRKMWYLLAEVGAVETPQTPAELDAAIDAWARRQKPELAALRFASTYVMQRLIESMKKWCKRVGAKLE